MGNLAIAEFARSSLVLPIPLAVSAAPNPTDLFTKLTAFHKEA